MSARARKSKATEPQKVATPKKVERSRTSVSVHSTPIGQVPRERSASPLNISRSEEKDELAHLNNRLASYIDYVRKLERDKDSLTRRISTITEERLSQVDDARKTYEQEIASLRRLVDDLSKQKATADIEMKKNHDDAIDAKNKLSVREAELRNIQRKLDVLERDLASAKQNSDRYQQLRPEHDALEKKYNQLRKDLESETILRKDLENKVAGLRDELAFKSRLFDEERIKLVQKSVVVEEEIEDRKAAEYQSKLADEIQAYREDTANELCDYRIQLEATFQSKLDQLRQANADASRDSGKLRQDLLLYRSQCDELQSELSKKSSEIDMLTRRVKDLEGTLAREREDHDSQLAAMRDEVSRLQAELELRFAEFTDLMNTKVALDQEILMYRKMIEGEESRLNIASPSRSSVFGLSGAPSAKRRRFDSGDDLDEEGDIIASGIPTLTSSSRYAFRVSTSANRDIEFTADQDGEGKWVKLINPSKDDVNIGNWVLKHEADGKEVSFKFHRTLTLKPNATCTIWGSDSDTTHNPPSDIVMKNQAFNAGANISITLLDNDDEEQASCMIIRERTRATITGRRMRDTTGRSDEKCSLM